MMFSGCEENTLALSSGISHELLCQIFRKLVTETLLMIVYHKRYRSIENKLYFTTVHIFEISKNIHLSFPYSWAYWYERWGRNAAQLKCVQLEANSSNCTKNEHSTAEFLSDQNKLIFPYTLKVDNARISFLVHHPNRDTGNTQPRCLSQSVVEYYAESRSVHPAELNINIIVEAASIHTHCLMFHF